MWAYWPGPASAAMPQQQHRQAFPRCSLHGSKVQHARHCGSCISSARAVLTAITAASVMATAPVMAMTKRLQLGRHAQARWGGGGISASQRIVQTPHARAVMGIGAMPMPIGVGLGMSWRGRHKRLNTARPEFASPECTAVSSLEYRILRILQIASTSDTPRTALTMTL